MEEALPGKSVDDIKDHCNILLEDIDAISSGRAPLPKYPKMQSNANKNLRVDVEWRRGTPWTEEEHRLVSCTVLGVWPFLFWSDVFDFTKCM
ncbi:hypothetical protein R3W88_019325 [Solanum pinnatisectum]|uniref:Uncharacterized protein n=1 Tax=Solanum pinnatisectum TaxID=50273 RepID=A0AAV9KJU5_9SOLN|nr:hypothetical protein R3W88_019325 [Solanum pinnatisectum]